MSVLSVQPVKLPGTKLSRGRRFTWLGIVLSALLMTACVAPQVNTEAADDRNVRLIATDLVSVLVQIREFNPVVTTLQFSEPESAFGVALEKALVTAGYGMQKVGQDQGANYVSYATRISETEAGEITDFLMRIADLEIRREYNITSNGVYPSSLMFISGTSISDDVLMTDELFAEQGAELSYVSGIDTQSVNGTEIDGIREIVSDGDTRLAEDRRTAQQVVLGRARDRYYETDKKYEPADLDGLVGFRRLVLVFSDNKTLNLGLSNKFAIGQLLEDYVPGDVFAITACDDIDGSNEMAEKRAVRIKEEFMGMGVPGDSVYRAPCVRVNYRHESDDSPVPVRIVQYRD